MKKLSAFENRMLLNQITIMAALKEHLQLAHGHERTEISTHRLDEAIEFTALLLHQKVLD